MAKGRRLGLARKAVSLLLGLLLSGCVMNSLSQTEADPHFNWDTLKRDELLLTPLLDLRSEKVAPSGSGETLQFFSPAESEAYAQRFKQRFYYMRKDIRVFGAGGAFEYLSQLPDLTAIGQKILHKERLSDETRHQILAGTQDIRFVFVFALTAERLNYDLTYVFREDQQADDLTYYSRRNLTVTMALWDSQENKTVWIGTKNLQAAHSQAYPVLNPSKHLIKVKANNEQGYRWVWSGVPLSPSVNTELLTHRSRFPAFPGREPMLSSSFDDFALGLPIQPSEEKLIAYRWFSYHRPELRLGLSAIGRKLDPSLQIGTSSIIANRYRIGVAFQQAATVDQLDHGGQTYSVDSFALGVTVDMEWVLTPTTRLLTGALLGFERFSVDRRLDDSFTTSNDTQATVGPKVTVAPLIAPRLLLLFGEQAGLQWGVGATYRWFHGIDDPVLKDHAPSPWLVDLGVAYAFRGF